MTKTKTQVTLCVKYTEVFTLLYIYIYPINGLALGQ